MLERCKEIGAFFKNGDRRVKLLLAAGLAGILLIALPQMFSTSQPESEPETGMSTADYRRELEQELSAFLSRIEGAGETKVLVTLVGTGETVYLKEQQRDSDRQETSDGENITSRQSTSESYVLTDGKEGRTTVVSAQLEPEIKGVVVVCAGGSIPTVQEQILEAVTTALHISADRVYVSKLAA